MLNTIPAQITSVVYVYVILFRMHERDTATETVFDIVLQKLPDGALAQRFKLRSKWSAKVTNASKYV